MRDLNPKAFNPPEEKVYGYCEWCGGEIYNSDNIYNEKTVCRSCIEYADSWTAVADFIDAYPRAFTAYLREVLGDDEKFAIELIKDYRDFEEAAFSTWLNSGGCC